MTKVIIKKESEEVKELKCGDYVETKKFFTSDDFIRNIFIVSKNSDSQFGLCNIEDDSIDYYADTMEALISTLEQNRLSFRVIKRIAWEEV